MVNNITISLSQLSIETQEPTTNKKSKKIEMTETYIEMLQNLELSKEDLEEKIYKCAKETIEGFQKLYLNKKEILSLFNTSEHNNESWE